MTDLRTTYMGIPLANPVVVGACSLSKKIETIQRLEEAGAGALVIKSLFEEQVQIERHVFDDELHRYDDTFAEALSIFPRNEHAGPKEHLFWIRETRKAVRMPLIASLNAVNPDTWVEWARELETTGVDGLELNFYSPPLGPDVLSADIEKREIEIVARVRAAVRIPIAVKLHPFYTSLMNVVTEMDKAGANAFVLFNRLFQPDINVDKEEKRASVNLSSPSDTLVPLRWTALLCERVKADLVASSGIASGKDVAKLILAGAKAIQAVSILYKNPPSHVGRMVAELETWMKEHGYPNLEAFRGKLARRSDADAWSYERGQYIRAVVGVD